MSFAYSTLFPITNDITEYELIEKNYLQINPMKIRRKSLMLKYSHWMHLDLKKKINYRIIR